MAPSIPSGSNDKRRESGAKSSSQSHTTYASHSYEEGDGNQFGSNDSSDRMKHWSDFLMNSDFAKSPMFNTGYSLNKWCLSGPLKSEIRKIKSEGKNASQALVTKHSDVHSFWDEDVVLSGEELKAVRIIQWAMRYWLQLKNMRSSYKFSGHCIAGKATIIQSALRKAFTVRELYSREDVNSANEELFSEFCSKLMAGIDVYMFSRKHGTVLKRKLKFTEDCKAIEYQTNKYASKSYMDLKAIYKVKKYMSNQVYAQGTPKHKNWCFHVHVLGGSADGKIIDMEAENHSDARILYFGFRRLSLLAASNAPFYMDKFGVPCRAVGSIVRWALKHSSKNGLSESEKEKYKGCKNEADLMRFRAAFRGLQQTYSAWDAAKLVEEAEFRRMLRSEESINPGITGTVGGAATTGVKATANGANLAGSPGTVSGMRSPAPATEEAKKHTAPSYRRAWNLDEDEVSAASSSAVRHPMSDTDMGRLDYGLLPHEELELQEKRLRHAKHRDAHLNAENWESFSTLSRHQSTSYDHDGSTPSHGVDSLPTLHDIDDYDGKKLSDQMYVPPNSFANIGIGGHAIWKKDLKLNIPYKHFAGAKGKRGILDSSNSVQDVSANRAGFGLGPGCGSLDSYEETNKRNNPAAAAHSNLQDPFGKEGLHYSPSSSSSHKGSDFAHSVQDDSSSDFLKPHTKQLSQMDAITATIRAAMKSKGSTPLASASKVTTSFSKGSISNSQQHSRSSSFAGSITSSQQKYSFTAHSSANHSAKTSIKNNSTDSSISNTNTSLGDSNDESGTVEDEALMNETQRMEHQHAREFHEKYITNQKGTFRLVHSSFNEENLKMSIPQRDGKVFMENDIRVDDYHVDRVIASSSHNTSNDSGDYSSAEDDDNEGYSDSEAEDDADDDTHELLSQRSSDDHHDRYGRHIDDSSVQN